MQQSPRTLTPVSLFGPLTGSLLAGKQGLSCVCLVCVLDLLPHARNSSNTDFCVTLRTTRWKFATRQATGLRLCLSVVCAEVRPQRSAADVRRELEAREESRNTVKLIWRALASMASGQPNTLCISALFWPRVSSVNT